MSTRHVIALAGGLAAAASQDAAVVLLTGCALVALVMLLGMAAAGSWRWFLR